MRFNFDDESVQDVGVRFPKLDLKKDEVARVCAITPYFDVTIRHWVDRVGYVHCHGLKSAKSFADLVDMEKNPKVEECVMCAMSLRQDTKDMVNLPMRHAATYVLRYHTDTRGNLLHGQLGYHLEVWLLSNKKYKEIISLQKEWGGLQHYDLELTCVDNKYKNFDIGLKKEALWEKSDKEIQKKIIAYVKEEIEKYPLTVCLGEDIPEEMLKRRFEVIRRKNYPDEDVDLGVSSMGSEELSDSIVPQTTVPQDDPFRLTDTGGEIPSAVTEEEKAKAQEPEKGSSLDDLIPD